MRPFGVAIFFGIVAAAAGCASDPAASLRPSRAAAGKAQPVPQYCISDGAGVTRTCELSERQMLSAALTDVPRQSRPGGTVVLVRRGPEGLTKEVIPLDSAGRLADPAADRVLRDGDQIVVPVREPSPIGLARPMAVRGAMN